MVSGVAASTNSSFPDAAAAITAKLSDGRYNTLSIISAFKDQTDGRLADFKNAILHTNSSLIRLDNHTSVTKGVQRSCSIILLDEIASFRVFARQLTAESFNFRGLFLFVLADGRTHQEIFATCWKLSIYNVDVLIKADECVQLMTFMPFRKNSSCGDTSSIMIDRYVNGTFDDSLRLLFSEKFADLQQCPIKSMTFEEPPAVIEQKNESSGAFEIVGYEVELIESLSKALNFRLDVQFLKGTEQWGFVHQNGSVSGKLASLMNGKAEIAFGNYFLKANRIKYLDCSLTYFNYPIVFVIPPGRRLNPLEKLLSPFDWIVWLLLFGTLALSSLSILLITLLPRALRNLIFGRNVKHPFMNMLIAIVGGSQPAVPRRNFARFILMMFLMFCLILRNAYQGSLYRFLQTDSRLKEAQNIDELIQGGFQFYMFESYMDTIIHQPQIYDR